MNNHGYNGPIRGKIVKKLIPVLSIILILFTAISCNPENAPSVGGIRISINNGISRGIEPNISLDAAEYVVRGSGPNSQEFNVNISSSSETYTKTDLLPGEWTITADAVNSEKQVIGSDTVTVTVKPGQTTEAGLMITEEVGEGTINISLSAPSAGYTAVISKVTDGSLAEYKSEKMVVQENGSYSASFSLMNGYYTLSFISGNSAVSLPAPVAFRIVKGDTLSVSFMAESKNDGFNITINDNIVSTPVLTLTASPDTAVKGGTISVNASADEGTYAYQWYVDGLINTEESGSSLQVSFTEAGSHEVSCIAADSSTGIIISAKTTVTVTEEE